MSLSYVQRCHTFEPWLDKHIYLSLLSTLCPFFNTPLYTIRLLTSSRNFRRMTEDRSLWVEAGWGGGGDRKSQRTGIENAPTANPQPPGSSQRQKGNPRSLIVMFYCLHICTLYSMNLFPTVKVKVKFKSVDSYCVSRRTPQYMLSKCAIFYFFKKMCGGLVVSVPVN